MKLLGVDHIHFFATDLDEAVRFYEDMGFELVQRFEHGGRKAVQMRSGFGLTVDVNKTGVADNPGYSHFSVLVDDVREAYVELREKGYEVDGPTFNEDTRRHIITVRDPNGFLFQMVQAEQRS